MTFRAARRAKVPSMTKRRGSRRGKRAVRPDPDPRTPTSYAHGQGLRESARASRTPLEGAEGSAGPAAHCSSSRTRGASPSWFPFATGGWCGRRSPSIAGRRSTWRRTWRTRRPPACACRRAATAHLLNFGDVRHAGTAGHLRHQRPGRDPARALGVGRQAPGRELRPRLPQQRVQRRSRPRCGARLRALLSQAHGGVQHRCRPLDVWYASVDVEDSAHESQGQGNPQAHRETVGRGSSAVVAEHDLPEARRQQPGRCRASRTTRP